MRFGLLALGLLALLLLVGFLALRQAYPPARLAALLAQQVGAATGRNFRVDGELSIRLLPNIAIEATDIALANADWGEAADMVRARRVAFQISLRDLLHGLVRVASVELQGAELQLESDGAGRVNWRFDARQAPASAASERAPLQLELDRLAASDVRVAFQDRRTGVARAIDIESLELVPDGQRSHVDAQFLLGATRWKVDGQTGPAGGLLRGSEDWPFDLRLTSAGAAIAAQGTLGLRGRAGVFDAQVSLRLDSPELLAEFGVGAGQLPMPLELGATLARTREQLRLDPLRLSIAGQVLTGSATLDTRATPLRLDAQLAAASLDLAPWLSGGRAGNSNSNGNGNGSTNRGSTREPGRARTPFFSHAPLPWPTLPEFPASLSLRIERLSVPGLPPISGLETRLNSGPQQLDINPLNFGVAGGQVRARLALGLRPGMAPRADLQLDADRLALDALEAARGGPRRVSGGRLDAGLKLALAGSTPASLAASANGQILLSLHDMRLVGRSSELDRGIVARLLDALLPSTTPRADLLVQCVVLRLPLRQGLAEIDRSIALETAQIALSASGQVDLGKQSLALAFQPHVKRGINLNPSSLVELLLVSGPLENPQLSLNPRGAVRQAANVGVAVATGGVSLLLPTLRPGGAAEAGCDQATRTPAAARAPAASGAAAPSGSALSSAASAAASTTRALLRPLR